MWSASRAWVGSIFETVHSPCHGTASRGKAPTVAVLSEGYASAKGNETELARLATQLREHQRFGGVQAHERLSAQDAKRFVRWLIDGGLNKV